MTREDLERYRRLFEQPSDTLRPEEVAAMRAQPSLLSSLRHPSQLEEVQEIQDERLQQRPEHPELAPQSAGLFGAMRSEAPPFGNILLEAQPEIQYLSNKEQKENVSPRKSIKVEGPEETEKRDITSPKSEELEDMEVPKSIIPSVRGEDRFSLLNRLSDAQKQVREGQLTDTLYRAGVGIGSSIARAKPDYSLADSLEKQTMRPVEEVEEQLKARQTGVGITGKELDLTLQEQMMDPKSGISEAARAFAKKALNIEVPPDMSAAQLEKLGFKGLGASLGGSGAWQFLREEQPDGRVVNIRVNKLTGEKEVIGTTGYAQQFRKDPRTGELIPLSPATGAAMGRGSLQQPQQPVVSGGEGFDLFQKLNPIQRELVQKQSKDLLNDTKKLRDSVTAADMVDTILQTGGELGADVVRAIQNQLARGSGEVGAMTERDVSGFGGKSDWISRIQRIASIGLVGKLPETDRTFLRAFARGMKEANQRGIQQQSQVYGQNISMQTGLPVEDGIKLLNVQSAAMIQPQIGKKSGLTPEQRRARIQELRQKNGQ